MRDPRDRHSPAEHRLLEEINVTPFIDVMLVLLVIFMVAAPLMASGVPLSLPKISVTAPPPAGKPLVVSIDKEGRVFVGQDETAPDALTEKLKAALDAEPPPVVYVRGDRDLAYEKVMDLIARLGAAGASRLSLLGEGQTPPEGAPR